MTGLKANNKIKMMIILCSNWPAFSQQSVLLDEKYLRSQLFLPHTRLPLHSESLSQSPSPSLQGPSSSVSQHSCTSECDPRAQLWYTSTYTKLGLKILCYIQIQNMKLISKSRILFRIILLGQLFELQLADWDEEPGQVFPPYWGDGELHDLYLYLVPPPQDRLQVIW